MRQKSVTRAATPEQIVKDIRRATRKHYFAEEKIRVVLEGLRGEYSIAELCRREGRAAQTASETPAVTRVTAASQNPGVCQSSCHLNFFHAASRSCSAMGAPPPASWGSASAPPRPCRSSLGRSGLSQTDPTGSQFRVLPDQRAGLLARAA